MSSHSMLGAYGSWAAALAGVLYRYYLEEA